MGFVAVEGDTRERRAEGKSGAAGGKSGAAAGWE